MAHRILLVSLQSALFVASSVIIYQYPEIILFTYATFPALFDVGIITLTVQVTTTYTS
jgi:hypothetical protein